MPDFFDDFAAAMASKTLNDYAGANKSDNELGERNTLLLKQGGE